MITSSSFTLQWSLSLLHSSLCSHIDILSRLVSFVKQTLISEMSNITQAITIHSLALHLLSGAEMFREEDAKIVSIIEGLGLILADLGSDMMRSWGQV